MRNNMVHFLKSLSFEIFKVISSNNFAKFWSWEKLLYNVVFLFHCFLIITELLDFFSDIRGKKTIWFIILCWRYRRELISNAKIFQPYRVQTIEWVLSYRKVDFHVDMLSGVYIFKNYPPPSRGRMIFEDLTWKEHF